MKILLCISVLTLALGITLFFEYYYRYLLWNKSALSGFCEVKGVVTQGLCDHGGCFNVYFRTHVVGLICTTSEWGGTYNTKEQAKQWANGFYRSYSCFYQKANSCDFSRNLLDTKAAFIASCIFTIVGGIMFLNELIILIIVCIVRKKRQYQKI